MLVGLQPTQPVVVSVWSEAQYIQPKRNNLLSYKISYMFRLIIYSHRQAAYQNKTKMFTVYLVDFFNIQSNDGCILDEICIWFSMIIKLLCSDRTYCISDYSSHLIALNNFNVFFFKVWNSHSYTYFGTLTWIFMMLES
jgi:hypothetical protein